MLDRPPSPSPYDLLPKVPTFTLSSSDTAEGGRLPDAHVAHSHGGQNLSPQLSWSGFPADTAGFAVTCFDPDAPSGSGFWHWGVAGIPRTVTGLPRGAGAASGKALPPGAFQIRNDGGSVGYTGAAPPKGDRPHHYIFAVHALDTSSLRIGPDVAPAVLGLNLTFHTIARATLTALYQAT
ncbi:MAG TPA: YbhB/YbcL family Raf kinase inhibitor-like protein [Acidimicrobiales bacterium]|nr:YbhB/YbcL family Raf kinase inhibitor-like protein [Acidimicrobiales bacterium]